MTLYDPRPATLLLAASLWAPPVPPATSAEYAEDPIYEAPGIDADDLVRGRYSQAVAIDTAGRAHAVYLRRDTVGALDVLRIEYAQRDRPSFPWSETETVGALNATMARLALQVDKVGTLHLIYGADTLGHFYRSRTSGAGSWSEPEAVSAEFDDDARAGHSLQVNSFTGQPNLAFTGADGALKFATRGDPGSWSVTTVSADPDSGFSPSLAPAGLANGKIAHYDGGAENLLYSFQRFEGLGVVWDTELVEAAGSTGFPCSLAVLPDGTPAVAYGRTRDLQAEVAYAIRGSGSLWSSETVRFFGSFDASVVDCHLAIGPAGKPDLLYQLSDFLDGEGSYGLLARARRQGDGPLWAGDTLLEFVNRGFGFGAATNGAGAPLLLAAIRAGGTGLAQPGKVVSLAPAGPNWTFCNPVDDVPGLGGNATFVESRGTSIAVGSDGARHLALQIYDGSPHNVYLRVEGGEVVEATHLSDPGTSRAAPALALGPDGTVYIAAPVGRAGRDSLTLYTIPPGGAATSSPVPTGTADFDALHLAASPDGSLLCAMIADDKLAYLRRPAGGGWSPSDGLGAADGCSLAAGPGRSWALAWTEGTTLRLALIGAGGGAPQFAEFTTAGPDPVCPAAGFVFAEESVVPGVAYVDAGVLSIAGFDGPPVELCDRLPERAAVAILPPSCPDALEFLFRGKGEDARAFGHVRYDIASDRCTRTLLGPLANGDAFGTIAAARGPGGHPCALVSNGADIALATPADGLDLDRDGIPLLLENFLCLSPHTANELTIPPARTLTTGERVVLAQFLPLPPTGDVTTEEHGAYALGEFNIGVHFSTDLRCWLHAATWARLDARFYDVDFSRAIIPGPPRVFGVQATVPAPVVAKYPDLFSRFAVRRTTPLPPRRVLPPQ